MDEHHKSFYEKNSKKYKEYEFKSKSSLISGEKPDFLAYLKRYSDKTKSVLDLGCSSGELTIKASCLFKSIIGIDLFKDYIETAKKKSKSLKIKNTTFIKADAHKLPFEENSFDLIYSSRGPMSLNIQLIKECVRVLKPKGILIEETIGEEDKLELKKAFGRGQNFPYKESKLESIKKLLKAVEMKLLDSKEYHYYQQFNSVEDVLSLLRRAPIIPNFEKISNPESIISKLCESDESIVVKAHRVIWIAEK